MTYERFAEIWNAAMDANGINDPDREIKLPCTGASKHTIDALIAASNGDFSHFDRANEIIQSRGHS